MAKKASGNSTYKGGVKKKTSIGNSYRTRHNAKNCTKRRFTRGQGRP